MKNKKKNRQRKREELGLNLLSIFCFSNLVLPRAWEALPGRCGEAGREGRQRGLSGTGPRPAAATL